MLELPSVVVVMSSYNGAKTITKQLDSIFAQQDVDVTCIIRDDGSTDNTLEVISKHPCHEKIIVLRGNNLGYGCSFMTALKNAPNAQYYAFADQDDVWFPEKLITGINLIKIKKLQGPVLYHCNRITVNENLIPLKFKLKKIPFPTSRPNSLTQQYAQGCSIILNHEAKELVCKYWPSENFSHDFWCGMLCYLFGKVIYDDRKLFYFIRYDTNTSDAGRPIKGYYAKLKNIFSDTSAYFNPAPALLKGYADLINKTDSEFLDLLLNYKHDFRKKLRLLFSLRFRRFSLIGTLSLKIAILMNKI